MYTIVVALNLTCIPTSHIDVGLYDRLSYLNHSCDPNAVLLDTDHAGTKALVALRPIAEDDEVAFAYMKTVLGPTFPALSRRLRRRLLLDVHGFVCVCPKCRGG